MPKVTNAVATRKRRKRVIQKAKGYFGNKSRLFRYAKDAVTRAGKYAFRDRRKRKGEFRGLWIVRINAACRMYDMPYSRLMDGLKKAGVQMNRKMLSELAIHDEAGFRVIVEKAKAALA